ncbi:MAG: winged helix-turn-helix transcriptional regulator [Actinobacteria bacterium]|nr:winged helix-turn-helix transcriptional regulator [Actinomycetota bacterium]
MYVVPLAAQTSIQRGAELLKVLANPVRLGVILELEKHDERCVHELVASLDVSQPLMSQHLRVLRSANLIVGRRDGKEMRYVIADDHVIHIVRDAIRHAQEAQT